MSVLELLSEAVAMREHNGFDPCRMETLDRKIACVYAELEELTEALQIGDANDIAAELADVTLYLLTMLGDLCGSDVTQCSEGMLRRSPHAAPEVLTAPIRKHAWQAWEAWRKHRERDAIISLELALLETRRLATALRVDLVAAVKSKIAVNLTRGSTHGGKRACT